MPQNTSKKYIEKVLKNSAFLDKELSNSHLFHVHTYRCAHSDIDEEKAIKTAIEKGFKTISFTDHAPFYGNPFKNRMKYEELDGYVDSLRRLREKYKEEIDVVIGFEAEYFPGFDKQDYYSMLRDKGAELIILGQHMAQMQDGSYTFSLKNRKDEYQYLAEAVIQGLSTGYFNVLAHPDRIFMRSKGGFTDEKAKLSGQMIDAAIENDVTIEYNICSPIPKFWEIVEEYKEKADIRIIKGYDIHYMSELDNI